MINEGKFGLHDAICLGTFVLSTKTFYTSLRVLIKMTGTAAWYTTLISCLTSLILFLFVCSLMKRFPGKELTDIFDMVTGKIIGKFLSLIFVFYMIYYAGSNLREFLEMIKAYALPYTAPSLIMAGFMAVVAAFAYLGLESIARVATMFFYISIVAFIFILIFPYPYYEIRALLPIGGYGIMKSITTGIFRSSSYDEIVLFAFIINAIHGAKNFKKIGIVSLLLSGAFISSSLVCVLMAFDYTQGSENLSDLFQLVRIIYLNRFFQRIEPIFIFIWVMSSFISVGTAFYISMSTYCKAFKVEKHRPLILPFSFLTFMIALLPESLSDVTQRNIVFIREYSIFILYLIPILVLLIAVILGKKGDNKKLA